VAGLLVMPNTFDRPRAEDEVAMERESRQHTADEFGRMPSSGSATAGVDGPTIGAPAAIMLDALVEHESGVTPPPPPVSVRAFVLFFVGMFLFGFVLLGLFFLFGVQVSGP